SADPAERVAGLSALASVGESEVLDQLLASLTDPSVEVRLEALRALAAESGAFSVGPLVAVLRDAEPRVRAAAIDVIADVEDEEALPHLLTALDDPSEAVRNRTRKALGRMRSPATVELLLGAIERPAHRAVAVEALGELGEVATPHLLRALTDSEGEIRTAIRDALLRSGIVERMLRELENPRPARRKAALGVFRAIRPVGIAAAVVGRLSDPAPEVRLEAAHLLGELGDPAAVPALQDAFVADPDMDVVAAVETAYRRLSGEESR
ncbi:MAG: HEAT repeat domain-containing protein, partial [Nitriliruptorales bacterium]